MRRIETARLDLRPLGPDDLALMHRMWNDPLVGRYLCDGESVSVETAGAWLDRSARDFSERGLGLFGVRLRGERNLIGFCGFLPVEALGEQEVMYGLSPEWWGRGLATEAAEGCLRFAFEEAGLGRVLAGADEPNTASLRVIKKLGMKYVGKILPTAPEVPYFALTREEFDRRRKRDGSLVAGPCVIGHPARWVCA